MNLLDTNSSNYFNMSLEALHLSDLEGATNFIDLAISHATKEEFYMFQKVKILFVACLYSKCSAYIEENLTCFYKHCSLNIFAQVLYYYQQCSKGSISSLSNTLVHKGIPSVLAHEYTSILDNKDIDFFKKAVHAIKHHEYTACIDFCNLTLKSNAPSIPVYLLMGKSYLLLKQYAKAISYFQQATKLEPSNTEYRSLLAEAFYQWRKYDSALKNFRKIIIQKPSCIEAYLRIADIYNLTNHPKKANKYYKKTLRLKTRHRLRI